MKAPPAPGDRPSLASARKGGWLSWLLQEWGLLLLAAVLAVLIWEVTSQRVIEPRPIRGVGVRLVVAEQDRQRVGAVLSNPGATVTIEMTGSEREYFAVLEALTATGGGTPVLELVVNADLENEERELSADIDTWRWPVDNAAELKLEVADEPAGRVYKIEGMQQVHIARPPTRPTEAELEDLGYVLQLLDPDTPAGAHIQVEPGYVEFLAPRAILADAEGNLVMEPDEIDLGPLLAGEAPELGVVHTFELSFSGWRTRRGLPRPVAEYRKQLPPVVAKARLALQRVEVKPIRNRLEVLLHSSFTWEFDGHTPDGIDTVPTPMYFEGELEGPADAIAEIKARPEDWMWAIHVSEPEKGWPKREAMGNEEDAIRKGVRATIEWVPKDPSWIRRGVRFVPDEKKGQDQFFLRLGLRK